jgi:hypothetical protein
MNVRTTLAAFEVAVTLSAFLLADSPSGKIVSVDSTQIKISSSSGKETSYSLSDKCKVMLNNKESAVDKLTAGDTATLTMESRSSGDVVTLIDAKSAETKADDDKKCSTPVIPITVDGL